MPLGNQDLEDQIIRTHKTSNIWLLAKLYADAAKRGLDQYYAFFWQRKLMAMRYKATTH